MKFNDSAFMRRLAHNENLLRTLSEQHKAASEEVKEATSRMFEIDRKHAQQSAIVNHLRNELMGIQEVLQ